MTGDEATKQNCHEQFFPEETLMVLQNHVDSLVNELDEAYIRMEDHSILASMDEGDGDNDNNCHPRLPLISRHNNTVRGMLELVKRYLDSLAGGF